MCISTPTVRGTQEAVRESLSRRSRNGDEWFPQRQDAMGKTSMLSTPSFTMSRMELTSILVLLVGLNDVM